MTHTKTNPTMCPDCGDATYVYELEGQAFLMCTIQSCGWQEYLGHAKSHGYTTKYSEELQEWLIDPKSIGKR